MTSKILRRALLGLSLNAALGFAQADEPVMDLSIFLTSRVGAINLLKEGKFHTAIRGEQTALKIAEDQNGRTSLSLIPILTDEAVLHWHLAEYQTAEQELKWALALREKNLGSEDPKVADSLDPLAALYTDLNRLLEAEILEKRALTLRQAASTGNSEALAQSLALLARIEGQMKKPDEERKLYQRAFDILKPLPHPNPTLMMDLLKDLAISFSAAKEYSRAATCLEANLVFTGKNFPKDSVEVGNASLDLADFSRGQGEIKRARPLYEAVRDINQRFVGNDDQYATLPYIARLARANQGLGDFKSAAALWQRSLTAEMKIFGPTHPRVALALYHLAESESAMKKKAEAAKQLQQSLAILKKHFSSDHPLILKINSKILKL